MVPGSTFRYGSNFCSVTRSPRLSSRHPMDAAAMPLPRDETTPPVTNMYLAIGIPSVFISTKTVQKVQPLVRDPAAYPRPETRTRFLPRGYDTHFRGPAIAPAAPHARGDPPEARSRRAGNRADTHKYQYVCNEPRSPRAHREWCSAKNTWRRRPNC